MKVDSRSQEAILNDLFRLSGKIHTVITSGVQALDRTNEIISLIQNYNDFNENNDPYGEHDFGTIYLDRDMERNLEGIKIFWKIDYYNSSLTGYEHPLTKECHRVMTIMLAEEY